MRFPTVSRADSHPLRRPVAGTVLLAGTGALVGGVIGSAVLFLLQCGAPGGVAPDVDIPFSLAVGGSFGAAVGFTAAPLAGWTFLRGVSFRRAILGTAARTLVGAAVATPFGHPAIGRMVGYAAATVLLLLGERSPISSC